MNNKFKFWLDVVFRYLMPAILFGYLTVKEIVRLRVIGFDPESSCSATSMTIVSLFPLIILWLYMSTLKTKFPGELGTSIVAFALIFAGILVWLLY